MNTSRQRLLWLQWLEAYKKYLQLLYRELLKINVKYYKAIEGGRNIMCQVIEELANKREEKLLVDKIKVLMSKRNESAEQVMELLDIPQDEWSRFKSLL
jgi:hypothetical protein